MPESEKISLGIDTGMARKIILLQENGLSVSLQKLQYFKMHFYSPSIKKSMRRSFLQYIFSGENRFFRVKMRTE